jgi:integrase
VLSHIFSIAVKEWEWIDDNPVRKVRKPKEAKGRDRYLSDDERRRFLTACEASDSL